MRTLLTQTLIIFMADLFLIFILELKSVCLSLKSCVWSVNQQQSKGTL